MLSSLEAAGRCGRNGSGPVAGGVALCSGPRTMPPLGMCVWCHEQHSSTRAGSDCCDCYRRVRSCASAARVCG
eukprot:2851797-Prymnesium_polylepis.1